MDRLHRPLVETDQPHLLMIEEDGEGYFEYEISHPPTCKTFDLYGDGYVVEHDCPLAYAVSAYGLDELFDISGLGDWEDLAPGGYRIAYVLEEHPAVPGLSSTEYSEYLVLLGTAPHLPPAVWPEDAGTWVVGGKS